MIDEDTIFLVLKLFLLYLTLLARLPTLINKNFVYTPKKFKNLMLHIQLYSKKCTGRYSKVRDDDLSSKQGSLCTFKMIIVKIT